MNRATLKTLLGIKTSAIAAVQEDMKMMKARRNLKEEHLAFRVQGKCVRSLSLSKVSFLTT